MKILSHPGLNYALAGADFLAGLNAAAKGDPFCLIGFTAGALLWHLGNQNLVTFKFNQKGEVTEIKKGP